MLKELTWLLLAYALSAAALLPPAAGIGAVGPGLRPLARSAFGTEAQA